MTPVEDGEQCMGCLRYTYDPHQDRCTQCGWQLHVEYDDDNSMDDMAEFMEQWPE